MMGDLSRTSASHEPGFARRTSTKSATKSATAVLTPYSAHFEVRQTDNLGTNGGILKMDTPRRAARCRFSANTGVEELARFSSDMHEPARMDPARADVYLRILA